ncbi:MAG: surface layer protein B, partial [Acidobacteria bacterium]|nr:surface layer protein B [Acidobacteriota bacterium]
MMKKIAIFAVLFCAFLVVSFYAQEDFRLSPANPNFLKYQENEKNHNLLSEYNLGAIPSPLFLPHLKTEQTAPYSFATPSSYDLRNYGKVTSVKNQGDCGSCWAFATIASVESCLLPGETADYSENNLKDRHGFDLSCCDGGNIDMAAAYFTRWDGPVKESEDSYNQYSCYSPSSLTCQKHIQEVLYIAGRESALDNEGIKQAVMNYGA